MKTTVEIPDSLLEEARRLASREGTTVRALVVEGLRRIVAERKRGGTFHLRKATFKGSGLQPHVAGASWERIREIAYEGRGG
ncbi:MAG: type II toxin-antitoxin system VapB family antitoxin [Candidatus Rokubacteria bacterium]|nr:type II toxin-antitoxin system VapB family antitoxin [Candidatus Rokubacteria bacterium]